MDPTGPRPTARAPGDFLPLKGGAQLERSKHSYHLHVAGRTLPDLPGNWVRYVLWCRLAVLERQLSHTRPAEQRQALEAEKHQVTVWLRP